MDKNTSQEVKGTEVYSEGHAEKAIVAASETAVTKPVESGSYITGLLQGLKEDFIAANDGLDMDFVYMGTWLVINKKGNFVEKDDESVSYGDKIDIVVGQGEKRWSLWGQKDSPEDGQLLVACKEKEEAIAELTAWLQENPDANDRYTVNDIELRYMAYVVPVDSLSADGFPKIYLMSFAPTATIAYGRYAMSVYQGKFKNQGIAPRVGINKVVTRLTTKEEKSKTDKSISWLALQFEAVGMFNPADYGIAGQAE